MNIPNCVPEYYRSMWEDEAHEAELEMQRQDYYERNKAYRLQKYSEGCTELSFYPDECRDCKCGEEAGPDAEYDDIPVMICSNWRTCPVYKREMKASYSTTPFEEVCKWNDDYIEKMRMIGKTYEDPEGVWEITNIYTLDDAVSVRQIQDGNINYGKELTVPIEEVKYYLNGGK